MAKATSKSEIDRLIEVATAPSPQPAPKIPTPAHALSIEDQKDPRPSMWRVLLQLRVLLPYLSKVLPLLEGGILGAASARQAPPDTTHFDQGIAGIESAHRDLTSQVVNQTAQIKHMQEQITWLSAAVERAAQKNEELAEKANSLRTFAITSLATTVVMLLATLGLVAYAVFNHHISP